MIYRLACKLGCEGIVSKRAGVLTVEPGDALGQRWYLLLGRLSFDRGEARMDVGRRCLGGVKTNVEVGGDSFSRNLKAFGRRADGPISIAARCRRRGLVRGVALFRPPVLRLIAI